MLILAVGQSDDIDPNDAIGEAIDQCRASLAGATPSAAILFSAIDSFEPSIVEQVRAAFGGITVVGSTSAAEMSSASGYREDSVSLAVFASDTLDLTAGIGDSVITDVRRACAQAVSQALAGTARSPRIGIVFTDGLGFDMQITMNTLAELLPPDVILVGGASGRNDFRLTDPTYQFLNEKVVRGGVALALLSGDVVYSYAVRTGFRPIGPRGLVTRAEGSVVYEIDSRPATDYLAGYIDQVGGNSLANPLAVYEADAPGWYLRGLIGIDRQHRSLLLAGSVPAGASIQMATANTDNIIDATRDAVVEAKRNFPATARPAAAFVFSCAVRKALLGSQTHVEADIVRDELPAVPFAGMYCMAETAPAGGRSGSQLLNDTFVTLLLGT